MKIEFVNQISDEIEKHMQQDLVHYESSHGIDINYKPFSLVLTNQNNEVVGVLNAYTAYSEIYIDDMWIHTEHRGKSYGRKLIDELENSFKDKGFNNINLVTSAFQAPEFYTKCGFELEFTRKNLTNPKLTKFFFIKFFDDNTQRQGMLK